MNYTAQQYANLIRSNPYVRKFLDTIGWAEGADYTTGFGGRRIDSLAWHPYPQGAFRHGSSTTSAAGKYQFQRGTWERAARSLGLTDFSPQSQDIAALYLVDKDGGALSDVAAGNVTSAVLKTRGIWESFVVRPLQSVIAHFNGSGSSNNGGAVNVKYGDNPLQPSFDRFNDYLGVKVVTPQQRYMFAFVLLIIIFIFAFA